MIGLNRRRTMGNALPYDAEIEYLESTGTQWIDTGYKGNTTRTRVEMRISVNSSDGQFICGSRNTPFTISNDTCAFVYSNSGFRVDWASGFTKNVVLITIPFSINTPVDISITRGKCIIDGTTYTYSNNTSINQNNSFYLFGIEDSLDNYPFKGKIYYFKIYEDDVLVHNYIPVRKGGVGYMYDKVSKQLLGNSGSGNFILGNDVN